MDTEMMELCMGCLSVGRTLSVLDDNLRKLYEQIISKIAATSRLLQSIYMCSQCITLFDDFWKFQQQVINSYKLLEDNLATDKNKDSVIPPVIQEEINLDDDLPNDDQSYSDEIEQSSKRKKRKRVLMCREIELTEEEIVEDRLNMENSDEYVHAIFRCENCFVPFANEDDYKNHVRLRHKQNASKFACDICKCSFTSAVAINYHMNTHKRRFECAYCGTRFAKKRRAEKHFKEQHDSNPSYDFYVPLKERKNKRLLHQQSLEYPCDSCNKVFKWKASLHKHTEMHRIENGQKKTPSCEICGLKFTSTSSLSKHVRSSKHQIQVKLRKFPKELSQEAVNAIRSSVTSSRQKFSCTLCEARFLWRGNLLRHMQSHAARAKGDLVCKPCNRTFSSIATFQQHMKISSKHVNENDFLYMCSDCGKKFSNKTRLKDHVNWDHLNKYTHTCNECDKKFKTHTSLYLHKQAVHIKEVEFLCDHCGKGFGNKSKLRCHINAVHSGRLPFRCGICGTQFSWSSCLARHMRRVHRKHGQETVALENA